MTEGNPYDRLKDLLPADDDLGLEGYEVIAPLGEGGFGRVYRARQTAFDRHVAIKLLAATGVRDEIARRFERECRAIGTLSGHPHIVTIFDCGVTRWGRPYIVMEHMAGGSFAQKLEASGTIAWPEAIDATIKIASAMETAHRTGILHRDVKPENLLLSAYGEPKLADFGVASIPGGYQTHTGAVTASLAHAAPEVLEGERATRSVDVYSLGSTLFALIAGRPAFASAEDSGLQALIARTLTQPVPDLRGDEIPEAVCDVIERAMAKRPEERFASAHEMALALREAQHSAGLAPTELVVEPADAVVYATDALVRNDDASKTRLRERRELTPPTIESPARRLRWRSPIVAAAVVLLLTATTGGAIVANARRDEAPRAATAPSGVADVADVPVDENGDDAPTTPDKPRAKNDAFNKRGARDGGSSAFGGSSGAGAYDGYSGPSSGSGGGGSEPAAPSGGGGDTGGTQDRPKKEAAPVGSETRATIVLYHHWSDDGDYFFTVSREESEDALLRYDHRHAEGYVWATTTAGDGLIPICYSNERGCAGFAAQEPPKSGQYRTLYWYQGGRYGHYYSTDPNETYRGEPLTVYGYIRGSSI
ncbi:MAG TPA: serine/threonine-protein kinase [Actinomycetota bacterium]|nr:serine/threonine-protein kinase [Actinomycetota bacterium]